MRTKCLIPLAILNSVLSACSDSTPKLTNDEEKQFEAVMYLFTGIEDNVSDRKGALPWQKNITGKIFEFRYVSANGIYSSAPQDNEKMRRSDYVRNVYRLTSPQRCVFRFEEITQFSKGDSKTDFSAMSSTNLLNSHTFNFANAYKFELTEDGFFQDINLAGPRVFCSEAGFCENHWNSRFSGMPGSRFDNDQSSPKRRRLALSVIKRACPGKDF